MKNPGLERWRSDLWYMDDTHWSFARYTPQQAIGPEAETRYRGHKRHLDALGVPAQIGETVSLTYEVKGQLYTTDFTLCGFWETDSQLEQHREAGRVESLCGRPFGHFDLYLSCGQ